MKSLYISAFTLVCFLSLTSCSMSDSIKSMSSKNTNSSNIKISNVSELEKSKIFTPIPVTYDSKTKKLSIGSVIVSEGFPKSLAGIIAPAGEITFINSSVTNEYFFITKKSKQEILTYYRTLAKNLGWKEIKDIENMNDNNISFETGKNNETLSTGKVMISTSSSIPENLIPLKQVGLYVEVVKIGE